MKRFLFLCLWMCVAMRMLAQTCEATFCSKVDSVLRIEFEAMCLRDMPLKVAAAKWIGLDTLQRIRQAVEGKRNELAQQVWLQKLDSMQGSLNQQMSVKQRRKVKVYQIYKPLPQNITSSALRKVERQMDSLYQVVMQGGSFEQCVRAYSEMKQPVWIYKLQIPEELEIQAFTLKPGDVSKPFFTPQGIHILKVLESIVEPVGKHSFVYRNSQVEKQHLAAFMELLKCKYQYVPNQLGIHEWLTQGITKHSLFSLQDVSYTMADMELFIRSHPSNRKKQFEDFLLKSLLDKANAHLEKDFPALVTDLNAYRDSLLVREFCLLQWIKDGGDSDERLQAYFEKHQSRYQWKIPHFRGVVIHATHKKIAKQARKFLKKLPASEWNDAIRLTFQGDASKEVKAEEGTYVLGDNVFVDDIIFKKGKAVPLKSYPYTIILGKKMKRPQDFQEVRSELLKDFFKEWEGRLMARLRQSEMLEVGKSI